MLTDIDRARSALFHLDAGCERSTWVRIGMAAKAAGLDLADWIDWCATGANYGGEREASGVWRSFKSAGGISSATLFRMAIDAGWSDSSPPHHVVRPARREAEPDRPMRETLSDYGHDLWVASKPLSGVALDYLKARHCRIPPADGDVRWHASVKHPTGYVGAALVALITDVRTGEPLSLHRTWITPTGKADIDPPRLLLAGHRKQGGVIRLWPDESVTHGLGVAEGIESALSLAWAYEPTWSVIDAGNMAAFPVLHGIEVLTIAADNDAAGQKAADECAQRWANAGREVFITTQKQNDLNDAVQEGA
jgi:putative DNA primase/helicase